MNQHITFICKYSPQMASTRYRVLQYCSLFKKSGWTVHVIHLNLDMPTRWPYLRNYWKHYLTLIQMLPALIARAQVVYFHKIIPSSRFLKMLKRRNTRILFDFDDTPFATVSGEFIPKAYQIVLKATEYADGFIVASEMLRQAMLKDSMCPIHVIPTGLEVAEYQSNFRIVHQRLSKKVKPVVIGWSGSAGLHEFVGPYEKAFEQVYIKNKEHIRYEIVNSGKEKLLTECPIDYITWTKGIDLNHLSNFDIGIMPLPRNLRTESKGGFKILRYMASGVPTIASPVGPNLEIIQHGENGILASSVTEWELGLNELINNPQMRRRFQETALETVMNRYDRHIIYHSLYAIVQG